MDKMTDYRKLGESIIAKKLMCPDAGTKENFDIFDDMLNQCEALIKKYNINISDNSKRKK